MGALIQTKGTQRLAKLLNNRFDDTGGMTLARKVASSVSSLSDAFANAAFNLWEISDKFIAQNAVTATWPADGNDFLYPGATMTTTNPSGAPATNVVNFTFAAGFTAGMPAAIAQGVPVSSLDTRKIPKGTFVGAAPVINGRNFSVTLVDKSNNPVNVSLTNGEKINFAKNKHAQLVRRWRWYLQHDLKPENHVAIRNAISDALSDTSFTKIIFQTVEDTQRVLVTPLSKFNPNSEELDDDMHMHILLLTQSTTAPDRLDPQ
jgi:hypothetical protein